MIYLLPLITAFAGDLKLAVTKREMQPPVIQLIRDSCPSNRPGRNRQLSHLQSVTFHGYRGGICAVVIPLWSKISNLCHVCEMLAKNMASTGLWRGGFRQLPLREV